MMDEESAALVRAGDGTKTLLRKTDRHMTLMEERWVVEYLIDLNATNAWIRAGGEPTHAGRVGPRMLKHGSLTQIAVARAMAERSARTGISADRVLREVAKVAFGDPRVLFNDDGSLRAPTDYNEDDAAMIEGVKTRRIVELGIGPDGKQTMQQAEIQEVKIASKIGALAHLMRHLGLNNDKLDVNVTALSTRLDEAYRRTGRQAAIPAPEQHEHVPLGPVIEGHAEEEPEEQPRRPPPDDELARLLS